MEKIGIGVGIIIKNKENKILMLLRNDDVKKADSDMRLEGTWTLPSGKVKFGETIEEAGIRKTKQECNLDVSKIKVICVQNDVIAMHNLQHLVCLQKIIVVQLVCQIQKN